MNYKSRVWDKVSEGSTFIFGDTLISLKHSIAQALAFLS